MTEFQKGIYSTVRNVVGYSSATLAAIYTIGHIIIAMICTYLITGATLELAATNAIVEPCVNGVWFYILHRTYDSFRKEAK
tara:strand:- start:144 stop:386 length:243 start_codon:yes stop_codon:yes gene_type:complete